MAPTPTNRAAMIPAPRASALEITDRPYSAPQPTEIAIRVSALAINPADWATQTMGPDIFPWITYPCTFGCDIAGVVHAVGSAVTRFRPGDRIAGCAGSIMNNRPEEGGFQNYVILADAVAFPIPDTLSFDAACVIPLGFLTAAAGLFMSDQLALALPTTPAAKPRGEAVLIWGAASSVGSNAVQLARAAGYEVVATASPSNAAFVKRCGASAVVDYKSDSVVQELTQALDGKTVVGCFDAIRSDEAFAACAQVLKHCMPNAERRFIACAALVPDPVPQGVEAKFVLSTKLKEEEKTCDAIFQAFVGPALASGEFLALPEPLVVGEGLESLQKALDRQQQGVSARKIVVTL